MINDINWCVFVSDLYCWDWWMCLLLLSCLCTPQWGGPAEPVVCPALSPDQEFSPGLIGLYQPWPPGLCETIVRLGLVTLHSRVRIGWRNNKKQCFPLKISYPSPELVQLGQGIINLFGCTGWEGDGIPDQVKSIKQVQYARPEGSKIIFASRTRREAGVEPLYS